jgi:glyoxylase-like metal-dependent hydrolase (beta-lactamase superfamily II)
VGTIDQTSTGARTVILKQLLEANSSTHTYRIGCEDTRQTILIDPVLDNVVRDLQLLKDLGLTLNATLDTHVHADHLTSAQRLKARTGCKTACPKGDMISIFRFGGSDIVMVLERRSNVQITSTVGAHYPIRSQYACANIAQV